MPPPAPADINELAQRARDGGELRSVLLAVQVDAFVALPARDRAADEAFVALLLGLLPLVGSDAARDAERRLSPLPGLPPSIRDALASRLADSALPPPPSVFDEASLYGQADPAKRDAIRQALDGGLPVSRRALARLPAEGRERLLWLAARADRTGFAAALGSELGLDGPAPWDFADEIGREYLILALVALGFGRAECVSVALTLDPDVARSVPAVFRVGHVARTASPAAALALLEHELGRTLRYEPRPIEAPAPRSARPGPADLTWTRGERGRGGGALPDRLSRATTGRDRT